MTLYSPTLTRREARTIVKLLDTAVSLSGTPQERVDAAMAACRLINAHGVFVERNPRGEKA